MGSSVNDPGSPAFVVPLPMQGRLRRNGFGSVVEIVSTTMSIDDLQFNWTVVRRDPENESRIVNSKRLRKSEATSRLASRHSTVWVSISRSVLVGCQGIRAFTG